MRQFKYDLARSIAILFVVAVHSMFFMLPADALSDWYFIFMQIILFTGNAIFMMLSGKFNLRRLDSDSQFMRFYLRKIQTIVIPVLVVFFIRTVYDMISWGSNLSVRSVFVAYAKNTAYNYSSTEYWFIFALIGFLLVSPFLSKAFSDLSQNQKKLFIVIGLIWNCLLTVANNLNQNFKWGYLFSGFGFAYVVGLFIEDLFQTRMTKRQLFAFGLIALILDALAVKAGWTYGVHDTSPLYTVFAIALYILILEAGEKLEGSKLVSMVAKHSFSIYLVHMMVLLPLHNALPRCSGLMGVAMHWGSTAIVFIASLGISIVLDAAIIRPIQVLYAWAIESFSESKKDART